MFEIFLLFINFYFQCYVILFPYVSPYISVEVFMSALDACTITEFYEFIYSFIFILLQDYSQIR